jgi:hypothetical protein
MLPGSPLPDLRAPAERTSAFDRDPRLTPGATMSLVALCGTAQLKGCFNERVDDSARLLLVVSPTCADCLAGVSIVVAAARQTPMTRFGILVLWTAMRSGDSEAAVTWASGACSGGDSGFFHFWEEEGWPVSTALWSLLGLGDYDPTRSAWDVYLFYEPGMRWVDQVPPTPSEWAHQLEPDPGVGDRLTLATVSRWLDNRP